MLLKRGAATGGTVPPSLRVGGLLAGFSNSDRCFGGRHTQLSALVGLALLFAQVGVNSAFAFSDDFSTDTSSSYTITDTWTQSGFGSFVVDPGSQRGLVRSGDNIGIQIGQSFPSANASTFSFDFSPTAIYPNGGIFRLRLRESPSTYYEIENTDGYGPGHIEKVVAGYRRFQDLL